LGLNYRTNVELTPYHRQPESHSPAIIHTEKYVQHLSTKVHEGMHCLLYFI